MPNLDGRRKSFGGNGRFQRGWTLGGHHRYLQLSTLAVSYWHLPSYGFPPDPQRTYWRRPLRFPSFTWRRDTWRRRRPTTPPDRRTPRRTRWCRSPSWAGCRGCCRGVPPSSLQGRCIPALSCTAWDMMAVGLSLTGQKRPPSSRAARAVSARDHQPIFGGVNSCRLVERYQYMW